LKWHNIFWKQDEYNVHNAIILLMLKHNPLCLVLVCKDIMLCT